MEDTHEQEIPKTQEELAYDRMYESLDSIQGKREELADALIAIAKTIKLDIDNDAPRKTEMKLSLFKTVDDILKSQENLHINKVKVGLQKKSEATNENVKQMAIEILRNIDMTHKVNAPVSVSNAEEDVLKKAFDAALAKDPETAIKDDELEVDKH